MVSADFENASRIRDFGSRRVQKHKRVDKTRGAVPSPSSSITIIESATIKGLATRLYFWTRRGLQ